MKGSNPYRSYGSREVVHTGAMDEGKWSFTGAKDKGQWSIQGLMIKGTGPYFPEQKIGLCITCMWCRMMNMNLDRINSKIFRWADAQIVNNWNSRVKSLFSKLDVEHTFNQSAVLDYMNTVLVSTMNDYNGWSYREEMQ
jgi:hypothetical protein